MRILVAIIAIASGISANPASAQDQTRACTPDYVAELDDDLKANADMRRWSTDFLRPACAVLKRAEDLAGSALGKIGLDQTLIALFPGVDPRMVSNTCRYVRKSGEELLTPEEAERRLSAELSRCRAELAVK